VLSGLPKAPAVRRGRPPNLERRREIVRQAVAAFAEHGYAGCTMADVAARCGLSRNLLLRYFARKELLLAAAVEDVLQRIAAVVDALRACAARRPSLRDFLLLAGNVQLHHVDELSDWYALWLSGVPLDSAQRTALRDGEDAICGTIAHVARTHGTPGDAYVFARIFLGALQSLVLMQNRAAYEAPSPELRSVFLDELVELAVRGVPERRTR
jgi:AcrR family transcriptional regulator